MSWRVVAAETLHPESPGGADEDFISEYRALHESILREWRAENVLAFGLPSRGKTHVVSAIGHELVQRGYGVFFVPAVLLVQRLLVAKKNLSLEKELRRLDGYDAVIIDDIGYIQQDREEM